MRELFRKDPGSAAKLAPGGWGWRGGPGRASGSEARVGVEIGGAEEGEPGEPAGGDGGAPQARSSPD